MTDRSAYLLRETHLASTLDKQAVAHVAHLARLKMSDAQLTQFAEQLSAVLDYVSQLNEVDTTDVPPTAHPLPIANVFRDDIPHTPWDTEKALKSAPGRQSDMFRVPKVLDQESA